MNRSTTIPATIEIRRGRLIWLIGGVSVLAAAVAWALVSVGFDRGSGSATRVPASVPASASSAAQDARRVRSIMALTPVELASSSASKGDECTIAAPPSQATIEAWIPFAEDFCELVSQALAGDVFRSAVIVTPELWHYSGATVSCRFRFGGTGFLTIRNSIPTCRWLARHATGWQFEDQTDIGPPTPPSEGGSNA